MTKVNALIDWRSPARAQGWRVAIRRTVTVQPYVGPFGGVPAGVECKTGMLLAPGEEPATPSGTDYRVVEQQIVPLEGALAPAEALLRLNEMVRGPDLNTRLRAERESIVQARAAAKAKRNGGAHSRAVEAWRTSGSGIDEFAEEHGVEEDGREPRSAGVVKRNGQPYRVETLKKILRRSARSAR